MKDVDINAYVDFVYNRDNEHNCSECPENEGFDSWGGNLPCGQQNCWVTIHCDSNEQEG